MGSGVRLSNTQTLLLKSWSRFRALFLSGMILAGLAQSYDDCMAVMYSWPRAVRTMLWAVQAGLAYKRFLSLHLSHEGEEYQAALQAMHTHWAEKLLHLCRMNGGVYVKAGQFCSTFGALPREFRQILCNLEDRARPRPFRHIRKVHPPPLGWWAP